MNLTLAAFYFTYRFFLLSETHFRWTRAYLVTGMIAAFSLPFLILPQSISEGLSAMAISLPPVEINGSVGSTSGYSIFTIMLAIYLAVVAFFILRSLWRLVTMVRLVKTANPLPHLGDLVYESPIGGSFSFLGKIYLETGLEEGDQLSILNHELVHLREKHAIDLFFAELTKAVFWINPFAWLYGKRLAEVHEFTADQVVTKELSNKVEYQELLVAKALGVNRKELIHPFINQSMLKRRIMMINKNSSPSWSKLRYALFIPVLGSMIALASCQKTTDNQDAPSEVPVPPMPPAPIEPSEGEGAEVMKRGNQLPENFTQPEFPGGMEKLFEFIGENVNYPQEAKDANEEGNVFTGFTVGSDGTIYDIKILKGVNPSLDAEAIRVLKEMPKWKSGKLGGKAVATEMTLPISFKLPKKE
jgi:TonB family protein